MQKLNLFQDFRYAKTSQSAPRCLDLFSGAGGLSLGFVLAGGLPAGAIDFHRESIETFRQNFPMATESHVLDIQDWHPPKSLKGVDVIIGGPPCQGFSLARGMRFVDDPRNSLYRHFVRIVGLLQPKWVVMENVEGITNIGGGIILTQILEDFQQVGYRLEYQVVNMAQHGVPQTRRRAIFVGSREGKQFEWPAPVLRKRQLDEADGLFPTMETFYSVNDALGNLWLPRGRYLAHRANSKMRGPRNRDADLDPSFTLRVRGDELALCEFPAQGAFAPEVKPADPTNVGPARNPLQEYFDNRPAWSQEPTALKRRAGHSRKVLRGTRCLTIREQARLQSFPDWFQFVGSWSSQSKQIGNAVPPVFAARLFQQLMKA